MPLGHVIGISGDAESTLKIQIQVNGKPYEVEVEFEKNESTEAVAGRLALGRIQSSVVRTAPDSSSEASEADNLCRSPIAGIVVRVEVQPGSELQPDDLILVLEAMKMETRITAPSARKVKSVNVVAGQAVRVDQILVEFEELPA